MRGEGTSWQVYADQVGTCSLCRGIIPAGEPFRQGKQGGAPTGEVCLSCVLTAVREILPSRPRSIVVERSPEQDCPELLTRYRIEVDGEDLGLASVDVHLRRMGREPEALLDLVYKALDRREMLRRSPRFINQARAEEVFSGD